MSSLRRPVPRPFQRPHPCPRPRRRVPLTAALLLGALAGLWPGLAAACPDPLRPPMELHEVSGRELWSPDVFHSRAGGDHRLLACGFRSHGYVAGPPDYAFDLTRMERYDRLLLRANASCDTVLLVRDAAGRWHFDDDSGTGRTASISLARPASGRYYVWIGSYQPRGCDARLTLETF